METERVLALEQRPPEFLPTSLNDIHFQHLHLICRPRGAVCRRRKTDIASGMPQMPRINTRIFASRERRERKGQLRRFAATARSVTYAHDLFSFSFPLSTRLCQPP